MKEMNGILEGRYVKKIAGGKMLKVYIEVSGNTIISVKFYGDYFIYPEDVIETLERLIERKTLEEAKKILVDHLKDAEMLGISIEDFCEGLEEAYKMALNKVKS